LARWPEMEKSRIIPNAFWKKLITWALTKGIKGKFTLLPCPAGLGYIDDQVAGYTPQELQELLHLVKHEYMKNFDITPEIFTHTMHWDRHAKKLLPVTEFEWMDDKDADTIADYMAGALQILKNVGIVATGITQPCNFRGDEKVYAEAVRKAMKKVNHLKHSFYFLNCSTEAVVHSPVMIADRENDEYVVSVVSASRADEPFWNALYGEGDIMEMADYYMSRDGKQGRFVELINNSCPLVFHAHSQTLYSNGTEKGFAALQEVINRVERFLDGRVEWLKTSELMERVIRDFCSQNK
jgi:hypothetical protein